MSTWVFLRGLIREKRHWGCFISEFKSCVPGADVYSLDLPGNGELNELSSPMCIRGMVEECRTQLHVLGLAPPYHILAVSMGAMVAVEWATVYANEVVAAVIINTSMRPFNVFYQRLRSAHYRHILGLVLRGASARQWEVSILHMTTHHPRGDVLSSWMALREQFPVSKWNALRQLWAAARFRAPVSKPTAELLVLASQHDQLVAVACSQEIAKRWGVPLHVHPSAGHDLTLDDGPWVAAQVRQWLLGHTTVM
jgi:pimeloyl-ACP methyl ester carboxylesterase